MPGVRAVRIAAGREQVVPEVNLARSRARHALIHVVGPPVVMPADIQVSDVGGHAVGAADEVGEAVSAGTRRVVPTRVRARAVVELGPRHRDEISTVRDVQVPVRTVRYIAVIEPDVMGVLYAHGVIARGAAHRGVVLGIELAVPDPVAHELEVAHDDVGDAADGDVAVHLGSAHTNDGLVGAHAQQTGLELAFHVHHGRRIAADGGIEIGQAGDCLRSRAASTAGGRRAHAGDRGPAFEDAGLGGHAAVVTGARTPGGAAAVGFGRACGPGCRRWPSRAVTWLRGRTASCRGPAATSCGCGRASGDGGCGVRSGRGEAVFRRSRPRSRAARPATLTDRVDGPRCMRAARDQQSCCTDRCLPVQKTLHGREHAHSRREHNASPRGIPELSPRLRRLIIGTS